MEKKTVNDVAPEIRDAFQKAGRLADDSARINALKEVLQQEPAFLEARRKLRDLERKKAMKTSGISRIFARMGAPAGKIRNLIRTNPVEAMALCEEQLAKTLDNTPVLLLLADAAEKAEAPFIAAEAMERVVELRPQEFEHVRRMARCLQDAGQADEAMKRLQAIATHNPDNKEIQAEYRAAIAAAAKQREKQKSVGNVSLAQASKNNAVGSRSAAILQILENTIHDAAQAKLVATELRKILETGESMDVRRKLAAAYIIMGEFDKAIDEIQKVISANAAYDPALDKRLEEAEIGKFDKELGQIKRRPPKDIDPAQRTAELEAAKAECKLSHALSRIEHYPNDIGLVYDLGRLYLERGEIEQAIAQFQVSVRSARCEVISRCALAECYQQQGKAAEAVAELETALSMLSRLDKDRPTTAYALAKLMEEQNNLDRARELYKEIYDLEPRFRDVAEKLRELAPAE